MDVGGSMINLKALYGYDAERPNFKKEVDEMEDSFGQQSALSEALYSSSSRKLQQQSSSTKNSAVNVSASSSQQNQQQPTREKRASIRKSDIVGHTSLERPANRNDIMALDEQLDDKLKSKVNKGSIRANLEFLHKVEHRENNNWKKHIINSFNVSHACDGTTAQIVDILTVSSVELGNLLRKVKKMDSKSQDEMVLGINLLYGCLINTEQKLAETENKLAELVNASTTLEQDIWRQCEDRIHELETQVVQFNATEEENRVRSKTVMDEMRYEMKQLNTELLRSRDCCSILESEQIAMSTNYQRLLTLNQVNETDLDKRCEEIDMLKFDLESREKVLSDLMEKEALRNAEIKKLTSLTNLETVANDPSTIQQEVTSVLCVRCKSQLDDLTSVEDAVFGRGARSANRLYCEAFRLLLALPQLQQTVSAGPVRQPVEWVRQKMRQILHARLVSDDVISGLAQSVSRITAATGTYVASAMFSQCSGRFYQFVYQYFESPTAVVTEESNEISNNSFNKSHKNKSNNNNTNQQHNRGRDNDKESSENAWRQADRLSLYTGVRALVMEGDSEAALFWTLLSDCFGQDGTAFTLSCIKILTLTLPPQHPVQRLDQLLKPDVYLSLPAIEKATNVILFRASPRELDEVLTTIAAMSVEVDVSTAQDNNNDDGDINSSRPLQQQQSSKKTRGALLSAKLSSSKSASSFKSTSYTGISLFVWLRVLLRQFQGDQIQRVATLQVMLDSIMVDECDRNCPAYPPFRSVGRAVFGRVLSPGEVIEWYGDCCDERRGKRLTADIVSRVAERRGFYLRAFHRALQSSLPNALSSVNYNLTSVINTD